MLQNHHIDNHVSAPRRPNKNPSENQPYKVKNDNNPSSQIQTHHIKFGTLNYYNLTSNSSRYVNARIPLEIITCEMPHTSE